MAAAEQEKEVYEKLSAEYSVKREAAVVAEAEAMARSMIASQVGPPCSHHMLQ